LKIATLNAAHYGVPQKRQRVFVVGFLDHETATRFQFPNPTAKETPIPLKAILLDDEEEKYYFSKLAVEGLKKSKSGHSMNKGRAQKIDSPCNTLGSHLAKVSLNSTDPVLKRNGRFRMFTPREVARIQSFPDEFELHTTKTTNYRALGNTVAPVVMWHVFQSIIRCLDGQELPLYSEPTNKAIAKIQLK